jgi:hypothetical protein
VRQGWGRSEQRGTGSGHHGNGAERGQRQDGHRLAFERHQAGSRGRLPAPLGVDGAEEQRFQDFQVGLPDYCL